MRTRTCGAPGGPGTIRSETATLESFGETGIRVPRARMAATLLRSSVGSNSTTRASWLSIQDGTQSRGLSAGPERLLLSLGTTIWNHDPTDLEANVTAQRSRANFQAIARLAE